MPLAGFLKISILNQGGTTMITCPKCGELNGDTREKCFKCFQLLNISEAKKKKITRRGI